MEYSNDEEKKKKYSEKEEEPAPIRLNERQIGLLEERFEKEGLPKDTLEQLKKRQQDLEKDVED